jgi:hypothetical protein
MYILVVQQCFVGQSDDTIENSSTRICILWTAYSVTEEKLQFRKWDFVMWDRPWKTHKIQIRVLLFSMVSSDCPTKHCCTTRMYMSWHDRASVKISGRKPPFDLEKVWISRQRVYFNTSERLFDLKKNEKNKKKNEFVSDLRQVSSFLRIFRFPPTIKVTVDDITEILLKVALNTITIALTKQQCVHMYFLGQQG